MKKQTQTKPLTIVAAAGLFAMATMAANAHAYPGADRLIAEWDTTGMAGTEAFLAGTGAAQISLVELIRGPGLLGNTGANSMNTKGWDGTNPDDYIQFNFTVASGYVALLDDLWIGTRASSTGPGTMGLYSSTDNYANVFYTFEQDGNYQNDVIDLSFLGPISGTFSIRLYEVGNNAVNDLPTASTGTFRVTDYYAGSAYNIGISGDVAPVPVPAAAWLLGTGLIGLIGLKRKRR